MMASRLAWSAAWSESARRTRGCESARSLILEASAPTVETVRCFAAKLNILRSCSPSKANSTSQTLSSGSPMPMKTTLRRTKGVFDASTVAWTAFSRDRCFCTCHTCSNISALESCCSMPMVPVAQNAHLRPQPTCEERQTVALLRPDVCVSCRMRTVSIFCPLPTRTTNFRPPTEDSEATTVEMMPNAASRALASFLPRPATSCNASAVKSPPSWKRCL
mmetsp:Transcript_9254/g.30598  ORF Transcript_9254/g.30598 Transcript_9254/m.30598 type:complete len:220 (+) Transcript_9254:467-1126(+)